MKNPNLFALLCLLTAPAAFCQTQPELVWDSAIATPVGETARMVINGAGDIAACSGSYANISATNQHHLFQTYGLDGQGNHLWTQEFRPVGGWNERAYWTTTDPAGNFITCGRNKATQSSNFGRVVIKYDPQGNELWQHVYSGAPFGNTAVRVETDPLGNIYVLGNGENALVAVTKLDPNGNQLWSQQVTPASGVPISMNSLAVADDGRVAYTCSINNLSWYTRCYDTNGALLWTQLNSTGILGGQDIAFDATGAAYVCGSMGVGSTTYGAVIKYSPTGALEWTLTHNGPNGPWDNFYRLMVKPDGNLVAVGQGVSTGLYLDWSVIQFGPDGVLHWAQTYTGIANNDERARSVAVSATGDVYVAGIALPAMHPCGTTSLSDVDSTVVKYDASGQEQWVAHAGCTGVNNSIHFAPGGDFVFNTQAGIQRWTEHELPSSYCPGVPNSSGGPAVVEWTGSAQLAANDLVLSFNGTLPQQAFGYFLASRDQGFVANPGGSAGNLCLANNIGRVVSDVIFFSGTTGSATVTVDNTVLPLAFGGPVSAQVGETWYFQAWHRDPFSSFTSNFSDGLKVVWY
ncbi:MAG: hypothetical protein R3F17_08870 [Planctomycetota bacterium]